MGQPTEAEDVERIRAVRAHIGPDAPFAIDANYSMTRDQAISLANAVKDQNLLWFEEPIIPDDYPGYKVIGDATGVPMAQGENLHIIHEFEMVGAGEFELHSARCVQLWRHHRLAGSRAAGARGRCDRVFAWDAGIACVVAVGLWWRWLVEVHSFPIDRYTMRPLVIEMGALWRQMFRSGVTFDWAKLEPSEIV